MPRRRREHKESGENKENVGKREPSAAEIVYRGPVISRSDKLEEDTHTQLLGLTSLITSNASGVFSSYFVNNITGCPDWADLVTIYDEYRVLGIRLEFFPHNRYSKTTVLTTTAIGAVRHSNSTVSPSSYAEVMDYSSARKLSLEDPWVMQAKMTGAEEAVFLSTAVTTPLYGIILYCDGLSASTTYGRYFFYWRVQFRGRK